MNRDIRKMAGTRNDMLVIGGGITGAFIAWDGTLRGLKVALIDKGDFGAATSAATSKLIHGGLRYLKTLEVGLVRESLQERRIMEIIAPHLVYPLPFFFPASGWGLGGWPAAVSAMVFYDTLSYDRKWINDDDKKIPGHEKFSAEQIIRLEPILDPADLKGGVIYYDCQMYNPERLTLEPILSAVEYGADAANYLMAGDLLVEGDTVVGARVRDLMDKDREYDIKAAVTVNAAGPWADTILGRIRGRKHHGLIRSKGIHIITRPLYKDHAMVLQTKSGRHFFIIPWRGSSLIGTTDVVYKGDPDDFRVTEADINDFLDEINVTVPAARLTRSDIIFQYGGLRPIVEKETSVEVEVYDASRKYEIYDHETDEGIKGFVTAIGGKYTTSRNMARQLIDMVILKLGRETVACQTHTTPLYGGEIGSFRAS
jgi:glycerol-3-phosphate dehydrogenase